MWWRKNERAILLWNINRHCGKVGEDMNGKIQEIVFWVQIQVKSIYEIIQKLLQGCPEFITQPVYT